jgi:carboxyl-terminal processing protease
MRYPTSALALAMMALTVSAIPAQAHVQDATVPGTNAWREDALALPAIINARYAYLDRLGGQFRLTPRLEQEANAVHDQASLLRYAENVLALLADRHAITGSSFADDWALVPSYSDMRLACAATRCTVIDVRDGSPAQRAAIRPGADIIAVGNVPLSQAVARYWAALGVDAPNDEQVRYSADVVAAGRRNGPRSMTVRQDGRTRQVSLPCLYATSRAETPLTLTRGDDGIAVIRVHDSLGNDALIPAFDAAMRSLPADQPLVIDLTDTASGGNTVVARAIMGWFVDAPASYQVHRSPEEERRTGIPRQWVEQVLPRPGIAPHQGRVTVRVGAWTGSMGEGLAVGMHALGAHVVGRPMAGLLGSIEDIRLPNSGLVVKLPTERLYTVDMVPREAFVPAQQ